MKGHEFNVRLKAGLVNAEAFTQAQQGLEHVNAATKTLTQTSQAATAETKAATVEVDKQAKSLDQLKQRRDDLDKAFKSGATGSRVKTEMAELDQLIAKAQEAAKAVAKIDDAPAAAEGPKKRRASRDDETPEERRDRIAKMLKRREEDRAEILRQRSQRGNSFDDHVNAENKDIRQDNKRVKVGSDLWNDIADPLGTAKEKVAGFVGQFTSSVPILTAAMGGVLGLFGAGRILFQGWMQDVPDLEKDLGNFADTLKSAVRPSLEAVFGDGNGFHEGLQSLIELMGGQTEETKRLHAALQGFIPISEQAKDANELWAESLAKSRRATADAKASLADYHTELKLLADIELGDKETEHAEKLIEIDEDLSASAEEKAVRIIKAEREIADFRAQAVINEREKSMEKAQQDQDLLLTETEIAVKEAEAHSKRITAIDILVTKEAELAAAQKAKKDSEGSPLESASKASAGGAPAMLVGALVGLAGKGDREKAQADLDKAQKARDAAAAAIPGGTKGLDPAKEKEAYEAKLKEVTESQRKVLAGKEHLDSLQEQANLQRIKDEREAEARRNKENDAIEKATGTGHFFDKPGIDEQNRTKAAGSGPSTPAPASSKGPVAGSSAPSGAAGDGPGNNRDLLKEIATNTSRIGSGGDGTSGGKSGSGKSNSSGGSASRGGSAGGSGKRDFQKPGKDHADAPELSTREKLEKWAEDKLQSDIASAKKNNGTQEKLNKAQTDHYYRLQHLDDATESQDAAAADNGKKPRTNNAVGGKNAGEKVTGPGAHGHHGGKRRTPSGGGENGGGGGGGGQEIHQEDLSPEELAARRARILSLGQPKGPTASLNHQSAESLNPGDPKYYGAGQSDPEFVRRKNLYDQAKTAEKTAGALATHNRLASSTATGGGAATGSGLEQTLGTYAAQTHAQIQEVLHTVGRAAQTMTGGVSSLINAQQHHAGQGGQLNALTQSYWDKKRRDTWRNHAADV